MQLNKVPALGLLVDEEVHLYTGADINMEDVKEFVNPLVRVKVNEVCGCGCVGSVCTCTFSFWCSYVENLCPMPVMINFK